MARALQGDVTAFEALYRVHVAMVHTLARRMFGSWYTALGFSVFSRDYLPQTLPLSLRGAASLVFHSGATTSLPAGWNGAGLLLATPSMDRARTRLESLENDITGKVQIAGHKALRLSDPSGLPVWVLARKTKASN